MRLVIELWDCSELCVWFSRLMIWFVVGVSWLVLVLYIVCIRLGVVVVIWVVLWKDFVVNVKVSGILVVVMVSVLVSRCGRCEMVVVVVLCLLDLVGIIIVL